MNFNQYVTCGWLMQTARHIPFILSTFLIPSPKQFQNIWTLKSNHIVVNNISIYHKSVEATLLSNDGALG